ncbi:MAG: UDP-N-acetylmuramoyl-L-alanyl-D-glutamate--2,6-diaminopimelate ligase [Nitrosomonas sp.]|nr:MAG: UDP-N-acetylmuramoyl-L-alanyl-D-glutamate--2,6-diaminopimelate ligase [Nitrosomonas sp.]
MKIKKLVKDIEGLQVKGSKDVEITGVCANSQCLAPGNLFIAKKGRTYDGGRFIPDALAAGAAAILTDIYDPSLKNVVQLIYHDVPALEATLAARYYLQPSQNLLTIGVTGTNGKTTTTMLIKHLLDQLHIPCGLIGTIEYIIGPHRHQASHTTPDVCSNHKMLSEMLREKCQAAALEVTSHALDQGRVSDIIFDIAVFTNLTLDHLDYHGTMEQYAKAKNLLFRSLKASSTKKNARCEPVAIVNLDDTWAPKIIEGCEAKILTYALKAKADLQPQNLCLSDEGSRFTLEYQSQQANFYLPLVGRFNVFNALAAIATGLAAGIPLQALADSIATFDNVPGRLEPVPNNLGVRIFVDFAHTDDALDNTLRSLHELKKGRILTVFGCGGDRDCSKRSKMAQASEKWSDITIITSDNPRTEKPEDICADIVKGFSSNATYLVEVDRRVAIAKAIELARPNDIILIAGKGHERLQIFAHQTIAFSDQAIAKELCELISQTGNETQRR